MTHACEKKTRFLNTGYSQKLVETEMKFSIQNIWSEKISKRLKKSLSKFIHGNLCLLYMNEKLKGLLAPGPIVFFRCLGKLSLDLVRANLHPLKRAVRSNKCNRVRCQICTNLSDRSSRPMVFCKKSVLKNFTQVTVYFLIKLLLGLQLY